MIANISPASIFFEDTANTLKYANRAKRISLKVSVVQANALQFLKPDQYSKELTHFL